MTFSRLSLALVALNAFSRCLAADSFYTVVDEDWAEVPDCNRKIQHSCQLTMVDVDAILDNEELEFPTGVVMQKLDDDEDGIEFQGKNGSFALFTLTSPGEISASIKLNSGRQFELVNIGEEIYVLIEEKHESEEAKVDAYGMEESRKLPLTAELERHIAQGRADRTTHVRISIIFYTTPEFRRTTSNVDATINQMVTNTNRGYSNSRIPITVYKHCTVHLDNFAETNDAATMLSSFAYIGGSHRGTLQSADTALLMISQRVYDNVQYHMQVCGLAYYDGWKSGGYGPFGFVAKGCQATVMGHELAHMFGALHNREIMHGGNQYVNGVSGYGNLIDGTNYYTIMGYWTSQYNTGLNMYSSPELYTPNGVATGDSWNDVRSLLIEKRFAMRNIGNQNLYCKKVGGSSTSSGGSCTDSNSSCPSWAASNLCVTAPHIKPDCRKSCGVC